MTVSKPGFSAATRDVALTVGSAYDLETPLRIGQAGDAVSVTGALPLIETALSQIAGTVSQTEAANLPLNGRNFLDLALLVPGVSPTNTAANRFHVAELPSMTAAGDPRTLQLALRVHF